jgi:hypothetical protein
MACHNEYLEVLGVFGGIAGACTASPLVGGGRVARQFE